MLGRYLDDCMKTFVENIDRIRALARDSAEGSEDVEELSDADALDLEIPIPAPRA